MGNVCGNCPFRSSNLQGQADGMLGKVMSMDTSFAPKLDGQQTQNNNWNNNNTNNNEGGYRKKTWASKGKWVDWYCSKCGAFNDANNSFCSSCNKKFRYFDDIQNNPKKVQDTSQGDSTLFSNTGAVPPQTQGVVHNPAI